MWVLGGQKVGRGEEEFINTLTLWAKSVWNFARQSFPGSCAPVSWCPVCVVRVHQGQDVLQARESLYCKLYGVQYTTPVVIMTSDAKKNDALVRNLLQSFNWFGRGEENFRCFSLSSR
jgi:hypothetical protein